MVEKVFPQDGSGTKELSSKELEEFLKIILDRNLLSEELLSKLMEGAVCKFIVISNYNVFLSFENHENIALDVGVDKKDCFLLDGNVRFNRFSKEIKFFYTFGNTTKRDTNIREATENQIKLFLESKGLEIKKVIHM